MFIKGLSAFLLFVLVFSCSAMEEEGTSRGVSSSHQPLSSGQIAPVKMVPVTFNLTNGEPKRVELSQKAVDLSTTLTHLRESVENEETEEQEVPIPIPNEYPEQTIIKFEELSNLIASGQTSSEELDKQLHQLSTDELIPFIELTDHLDISSLLNGSIEQITNQLRNSSPQINFDFLTGMKAKNNKALDIILRNTPYCSYMQKLWLAKNNIRPRKINNIFRETWFFNSVIAWSPDSKYLAAASDEDEVAIIDVLKNSVVKRLKQPKEGIIIALSWSADGDYIASAGSEGSYIWKKEQEEPIEQLNRKFLREGEAPSLVQEAAEGKQDKSIPISKEYSEQPVTVERAKLLVQEAKLLVQEMDEKVERAKCFLWVHSVAWHPQKASLLAYSCILADFESSVGKRMIHKFVSLPAESIQREGETEIIKTVLWDKDRNIKLEVIQGDKAGIRSLAWNQSGTLLACGDRNGTVDILQYTDKTENGSSDFSKLLTIDTGTQKAIQTLTWHPDNVHLAVTVKDNEGVEVWNGMIGEKIHTLGENKKISSFAWSPDGIYYVYARYGDAREVGLFIFNYRTDKIIKILGNHKYIAVAWSYSGKYIAAAKHVSIDIWPTENDEVKQACIEVGDLKDNFDPLIAMIVDYHAQSSGQKFRWNEFPQLLTGTRRLPSIIQKLLDVPSYWGTWLFRLKSWISGKKAILGTGAAVGLAGLGATYLYLRQKKKPLKNI